MPIVRLSLLMRELREGDCVTVEATDPAFEPDLVAWTRQLGHLLVTFENGDVQRATVQKGTAPK